MKCKLCLLEKPLCRSHIVPEFAYKPLYDSEHRFIEVTDVKQGRARKGQRGYWDKLLCQECEQRINVFEKHGLKLIETSLPAFPENSKRIRKHANLSYGLIKLFFLSVLWRASITNHQGFRHVHLGPHEEKLRKMLLENDPGDSQNYGVVIFNLHFQGNHLRDLMVEPTYCRIEGRMCYRFLFSGFLIYIVVASHSLPSGYDKLVLSPSKLVTSYDIEINECRFLSETWETVAKTTQDLNIQLKE